MTYMRLAWLTAFTALSVAPAAVAQTTPDYPAIVAAPDRSDADRKLDTNRAPAQWLAFIGARPGMTILDIFAAGGWKAELMARAVAPSGKVYAQNTDTEAGFGRFKDRLMARFNTPAGANLVLAGRCSSTPRSGHRWVDTPPDTVVPGRGTRDMAA